MEGEARGRFNGKRHRPRGGFPAGAARPQARQGREGAKPANAARGIKGVKSANVANPGAGPRRCPQAFSSLSSSRKSTMKSSGQGAEKVILPPAGCGTESLLAWRNWRLRRGARDGNSLSITLRRGP